MDPNQNSDLPPLPLPGNGDNSKKTDDSKPNLAANLIRQKIDNIFEGEPSVVQELSEIPKTHKTLSMHQKYLQELHSSGKSVHEIHRLWHRYYSSLPENEKIEVWEEFYASNKNLRSRNIATTKSFIANLYSSGKSVHEIQTDWYDYYTKLPDKDKREIWQAFYENNKTLKPQWTEPKKDEPKSPEPPSEPLISKDEAEEKDDTRTADQIKKQIRTRISKSRIAKNQGLRSVIFGVSVGFLVILIFLFSFFNDRFIAPFITPSRTVSAQSLIIDPSTYAAGPTPEVIIPKINVEIPVVYNLPVTSTENDIENSLEDGVVHYPTTPFPGQLGNGAIFGHSSNNILNPGSYKFAFVLLHDLQIGDVFYLTYDGKVYSYQIYKKSIVPPTDTSVLNTQDKPATYSLITCDPPGTSINRLVVVGEQISPDPSTDIASATNQNSAPKPSILPSNSPSLWSRLVSLF